MKKASTFFFQSASVLCRSARQRADHGYKTGVLIVALLFFFAAGYGQNVSFFQGQFNGGVTGCGYGPDYFSGGTGTLTVNIAPGSTIYKAWLFAGSQGPAGTLTVTLNGSNVTFGPGTQVSPTFQSINYGGNSGVFAVDVSAIVSPTVNSYTLVIPGSQSSTSDRFQDFYLYIAYANPALPQVTSCIFLNSVNMQPTVNDVFTMTYPIGNVANVGMAAYMGYACDVGDGEGVAVNGTNLGTVYAPNANSGECAGPYGDFYYQNGTLSGLLDGNPNQAMNGPDCISNIQGLVSNCATSVSATFTHANSDNALWGFFFVYTSDSSTATTDTSICDGNSVQLDVATNGGSVTWSPTGGLSCTSCPNPLATPTTTTTYVATITGGGCGAVASDTAFITVTNGTATVSVDDTTICSGQAATLKATPSSGGGTYLWTPGGATTQSITVSPASTTSYIVKYTSGTCGSASDTAVVTVLNPTASSQTQSICNGQSYDFHGQIITAAGTYHDTTANAAGCDSIITLTVSILPSSSAALAHTICGGQSYTFHGQNLTTAGTYADTLTNVSGCDSIITLTLTVVPVSTTPVSHAICSGSTYSFGGQMLTSAGTYRDTLTGVQGCDSVIILTLVTIAPATTPVSQSICSGTSYDFHGQSLTTGGTYRDTLTGAQGCDSIIVLTLTILSTSATSIAHSICSGTTYSFNGQNLSTGGIYKDTLTNAAGCDSIVTLTLSILSTSATSIAHSICSGTTYSFNGQNLSTGGIYKDTLTNAAGCDSIVTLTLSILSTSATSIAHSICSGTTYSFNGQNLSTGGIYKDTLTNAAGCDSIVTLTLSILSTSATSIAHSICSGTTYSFNGQNLSTGGIYKDTLTNAAGCDSIVTLTLSILSTSATSIAHSICSGTTYSFNGQNLSTGGIYKDTLTNAAGCDSIVTLTLTILSTSATSIAHSICSGTTYNFNGQNLSTGGIYKDTLTNAVGCDSIVTLTLTILSTSAISIADSICSGNTYNFNGQNLSTAGTYKDTLTNVVGCDSIVTLTLTVLPISTTNISQAICSNTSTNFNGQTLNTSGTYFATLSNMAGCDSTVILTLTVLPTSATAASQSICSGTSYDFNGQTLTTAGTYVDTLTNAVGCDSIVTLTLTVLPTSATAISQSICSGTSYDFNGQNLTTSGIYIDTVTNASGCDSVITLTLSVIPVQTSAISQSICNGTTYDFNGQNLSTAGTYIDTMNGVSGCDSIVTLTLTVLQPTSGAISQTICSNSSATFNGQVLTTSGTYIATLTNAAGCDSTVAFTLTVVPTSATALAQSICSNTSTIFNGQTLNSAGTYIDTFTNAGGCDSIVTLVLTVVPTSATTISQSICNGVSYDFNGQSLTTAGTYIDTLTNAAGCDSIVTLSLGIIPISSTAISRSICSNTNTTFGGQVLTTAGTYTDTLTGVQGCDSIVTLTLTVLPTSATPLSQSICSGSAYNFNGQTLSTTGTYIDTLANALGCDSIVTLVLTAVPTSASTLTQSICSGQSYTFGGAQLTMAGTYTDTFTGVAGCDSFASLILDILPLPTAAFVIEPAGSPIPLGSISATDQSIGADTILWQLNNTAISLLSGGQLPISDTGSYCIRLIARTSAGCTDTSTECIYVYNDNFYMPNAFTPNGDGINDYIGVYGPRVGVEYMGIRIFDRWGEKVFESTDLNFQWDGRYKGVMQVPGVYVYELEITYVNGNNIHTEGTITLIR